MSKSTLAGKRSAFAVLIFGWNPLNEVNINNNLYDRGIDCIRHFRQERDILSEAVTRVQEECQYLKQYMENLESRHNNAERVVVALRDALKDERSARTRAESQCNGLAKVRQGQKLP